MFHVARVVAVFLLFFFNDTATTEIYTLSLHDALPISASLGLLRRLGCRHDAVRLQWRPQHKCLRRLCSLSPQTLDRKSTRLNSSHSQISYAVFCLKKKKKHNRTRSRASAATFSD